MIARKHILILIISSLYLFPDAAYAYLDPGTGSFILQIVLAAAIGAYYSLKLYWTRVRDFLTRTFSKEKKEE